MWCLIVGASTALLMCCLFRGYLSHQKQQWEIMRLHKLLHAQKGERHASVIMSAKRHYEEDAALEQENKRRKNTAHAAWKPEPLNQLLKNSVGVQGVLMDDVIDEMQTEGDDEQDNDGMRDEEGCAKDNSTIDYLA